MLPEKSAEFSFQKKFLEAFFRRKIVFRKQMNSLLVAVLTTPRDEFEVLPTHTGTTGTFIKPRTRCHIYNFLFKCQNFNYLVFRTDWSLR